jgi:hypothetical protein
MTPKRSSTGAASPSPRATANSTPPVHSAEPGRPLILALAFGARTVLHLRRTGSSGFKG